MSCFGRTGLLIRAAALAAMVPWGAHAQSAFPGRPVTAVVPFAAGGVTDIITRSLSQEFQSITGQPLVVMNKPGGTGIIAAQFVKSAPHDGYTVLIGTGSQMSVLPALKPNVPFDAEKDFIPVSLLGTTPYVLLVHSSVPAKTLPELITLLQANPGKFNYSTSGFGSLPHLAGEMFKQMTKVEMTHVPYPGNSPATTAAVSGVVQITFDTPISSLPHVQAGTLRALAVAGDRHATPRHCRASHAAATISAQRAHRRIRGASPIARGGNEVPAGRRRSMAGGRKVGQHRSRIVRNAQCLRLPSPASR
jgi:tripartite-type tricarboxylate transporter receptor subunit TctC